MRYGMWLFLLFLLISPWKAAFPAQNGQKSGQASTPEEAQISPDTPVIVINGLCANDLVSGNLASLLNSGSTASNSEKGIDPGCKTVVTRQQYEQLLTATGGKVIPGPPPKFAKQYADMMLFAEKAREMGGEKDAALLDKLRYNYVQALFQFAMIHMQHQADDITDADVEKYFQEHPERFVRMHLQQISVPKHKGENDESVKADPAETEEMHSVALKIQKEAAAGANVEKLEATAYREAHNSSVPDVELGTPIPEEVPQEYRKLILDLQPGQVSAVTEDSHEYLIFKCVEKHTVPPAERKKLYGWLRMRDSMHALRDMVQTQFNQQYFVASPAAGRKEADTSKTP